MAVRRFFKVKNKEFIVEDIDFKFEYTTNQTLESNQKNIISFHNAIIKRYPTSNIIDLSTKSLNELGVKLSPFNLKLRSNNGKYFTVENLFQGSKIFEKGGPYIDLYQSSPWQAKTDVRLKNSGNIVSFKCFSKEFSYNNDSLFYNWIYIQALCQEHNEKIAKEILKYNAFTDMMFNTATSIDGGACQAEAIAIFVYLMQNNILKDTLKDYETFTQRIGDMKKEI